MVYVLTQYGTVFTASVHERGIHAYLILHDIPPHLWGEYKVMRIANGGDVLDIKPLKEFME